MRLDGPESVSLAEEAESPLGANGVRLRTLFSGISAGTEMTQYRGTSAHFSKTWNPDSRLFGPGRPTLEYPTVVGYEEVGEVVEVGGAVTAVRPGQVIWGVWGHRSTTVVEESYAADRVLDPRADPLIGIFSHIGSVALNVILDADIHVGETVAVFGLGVLGQIVAQLAKRNGARVIAIDAIPHRLELARRLGADETLDAREGQVAEHVRALTGGRGADVALEVTGNHQALHEAVRTVAYCARVVASGFYQGEASGLFLGEEFHHNRVHIVASQIGATPLSLGPRWTQARLVSVFMGQLAAGAVDVTPLISHVIDANDAASAFRLLAETPADALQVVLRFSDAPD
ncbi:MAG: zinc-binding alcohol dehydrogenase [Actinomycetota bacterium]|nr:zinc-binding alcohol dehydrogenase [Actinomycetota bacterium]